MNATDFFTRRILGVDYRVWVAMLLVCFLSFGLYSYKQIRFTDNNDQLCTPDTIIVNGKRVNVVGSCYLDRISTFQLQSGTSATVEWNFGDGTNLVKGSVVSHKFKEEGSYVITASVNGRCKFDAEVEVIDDPFLSGNQKTTLPEIYADPLHPALGNTVKFYCVADVPSITSYEWKVVQTNEIQTDSVAAFTFNNAGTYTIQLVINNDLSLTRTEPITVITIAPPVQAMPGANGSATAMPGDFGPLGNLVPQGANPSNANNGTQSNNGAANNDRGITTTPADTSIAAPLPKAPELDPVAFKDLLQNVIDQNGKELEDLYQYLDYKESTLVEVNESKSRIPLKEFCRNMKEKKKKMRKIESLSFQRDDKKSIQVILVKVPESKGFFDRLFH